MKVTDFPVQDAYTKKFEMARTADFRKGTLFDCSVIVFLLFHKLKLLYVSSAFDTCDCALYNSKYFQTHFIILAFLPFPSYTTPDYHRSEIRFWYFKVDSAIKIMTMQKIIKNNKYKKFQGQTTVTTL